MCFERMHVGYPSEMVIVSENWALLLRVFNTPENLLVGISKKVDGTNESHWTPLGPQSLFGRQTFFWWFTIATDI